MDDITQLRHAVKQVLKLYAGLTPSHGNIRLDTVFDEESDRLEMKWRSPQKSRMKTTSQSSSIA